MTRPFDVEIRLPTVLNESVQIEVALAESASPSVLDELSRTARDFFQLADTGAYVIEEASPEEGRFRVLEERREEFLISWNCLAAATDSRFAQTFRNGLVMFHQLSHPIARLTMTAARAPRVGTLPPLGSRPLGDTYPGVSSKLRFNVARRPLRTNRSGRRAEIECVEPIADLALHHTLQLLQLWSDVSLAAYARNEEEMWSGECAIFDVLPDIADDFTVELLIERFGAPEVAWHSFLNVCGRIDREIARISSVTIH